MDADRRRRAEPRPSPSCADVVEAAGRDPATLEIMPFGSIPDPGKLEHFASIGVTEMHLPGAERRGRRGPAHPRQWAAIAASRRCARSRLTDWVTIASLATAAGTLVLAVATFSSVRSSSRSARIAEQALLADQRPLLMPHASTTRR